MTELSKLAELRAKTDRDLVLILSNALELGLQCAAVDRGAGGPLRDRAADIYANAVTLLSKVENIAERRKLENKLDRLRASLRHTMTEAAFSSAC